MPALARHKPAHAHLRMRARVRPRGCKTASRKKSSFSRLFPHARCASSHTTPRESALFLRASVSGSTIFGYVEGNPLTKSDPTGEILVLGLPFIGGGSGIGGWVTSGIAAGALIAGTGAISGSVPVSESRAVPYPDRKRGKYTCICRADKNGRSPDNCSIDDKDFAMGYGEGSTPTEAKRAAEKDAKDKLGAKSVHHVQCRCRAPNGDTFIPTR